MKKTKEKQRPGVIWVPIAVAILSGIFLLVGNWQINWLEKEANTSPQPVETGADVEVNVDKNSGGTVIGSVEGSTIIISQEQPKEKQSPPTSSSIKETFRLVTSTDFETVVNLLRQTDRWTYDNQAQSNIFQITYTGEMEKAGEPDLFIYRGGCLVIKKDDRICKTLENIKVEAFDYPSNPRSRLEERIQGQIKSLVRQNAEQIAQEIINCLK